MLTTEQKKNPPPPAAALCALPHQIRCPLPQEIRSLLHIVDRQSRDAWKRLPLEGLPPHAGPMLVFDAFDEPVTWVDDWSGKTLHSSIEVEEIIADQWKYHRAVDGAKRAELAKRIRRRWWGLVDHAIGYRIAGSSEIFEFA